jgi:hypothetical protein
MHRLILGLGPKGPPVDHRNGNGLDNRRENIRIATVAQNRQNSRKTRSNTSSQYKGVYWNETHQSWRTHIHTAEQHIYLGCFAKDAEIEAAKAYDLAARELFGDFAHLNYPHVNQKKHPEEQAHA